MKGGQLLLIGDMTPEQVMQSVQAATKEAKNK
jgi:hypothetical protein